MVILMSSCCPMLPLQCYPFNATPCYPITAVARVNPPEDQFGVTRCEPKNGGTFSEDHPPRFRAKYTVRKFQWMIIPYQWWVPKRLPLVQPLKCGHCHGQRSGQLSPGVTQQSGATLITLFGASNTKLRHVQHLSGGFSK